MLSSWPTSSCWCEAGERWTCLTCHEPAPAYHWEGDLCKATRSLKCQTTEWWLDVPACLLPDWSVCCLKWKEGKFFRERPTATCSMLFGCVWSLGSLTTYVLLQKDFKNFFLEILAGEHSYSSILDQRTVLLYQGKSESVMECEVLGRTHKEQWGREGGSLPRNQINWVNPEDPWGEGCCSQTTLSQGC